MSNDASLPMPSDIDTSGPANPEAVKDFWLSVVRPAAELGKLEKMPTVKGTSPRGRDIARKQNQWLTRKSFSGTASAAFRAGYDRIQWRSRDGGNADARCD